MPKTDPVLAGRLANLEKANVVRTRKREIKDELRLLDQAEGCRFIAKRLKDDPECLGAFSVQELLLSVEGIGKTKATMLACQADWTILTDKIRGLTDERRSKLARALRGRADSVEGRRVQAA